MSMKKNLWEYVSWMLTEDVAESQDKLLTQPDFTEEEEADEQNVVANIAGVTTPLGTGPTYPSKQRIKRKSPAKAAGDAFGGARPPKKKRK